MEFINNIEELIELQSKTKSLSKDLFEFKCERCGKNSTRRIANKKNSTLLCTQCYAKKKSLEKYGVENPSQRGDVKEKKKQTSILHYGVENPMQSKKVSSLFEGDSNPMKDRKVVEKCLANRDFSKYAEKCKEAWKAKTKEEKNSIKEKRQLTCEEKYGDKNFNNREAYKETCLKKFGVSNPRLDPEVIKKLEDTNTKRCGYAYQMNDPDFQDFLRSQKETKDESSAEIELRQFVSNLCGDVLIQDRNLLKGKELDIYVPSKKVAIEFNGLYWHSDKVGLKNNGDVPLIKDREKARLRHLQKTEMCEKEGVRLIHIFEDDWNERKSICKSIIAKALGAPCIKIFARKCELKPISLEDYRLFLNTYHLQGYSFADIRLGLYFRDELIQCIGILTKGNHSEIPELVRMCVKSDTQVLGGFSKLLKHSGFHKIASYVDRATFDGKGYEAVGFKPVKVNRPVHFYVEKHSRIPRYTFMRDKIKKKFQRGELKYWNPLETEEINMYKNGYYRIWNCGTIKVEIEFH